MAKFKQPMLLQALVMYKSEKMHMLDITLVAKYTAAIAQCELVMAGNKNSVIARICELECRISKHEQQLREIEMNLAVYDQDSLELLHEELYQQNFSILNINEGSKPMSCPRKKKLAVKDRLLLWGVRIRRRKAQNGFSSVRIYIQRQKKFASEIERWKADQIKYKRYSKFAEKNSCNSIRKNMTGQNVFVRDLSESARNVEKFYLDMQSELGQMEKRTEGNEHPTSNNETSDDSGFDVVIETRTQPMTQRPAPMTLMDLSESERNHHADESTRQYSPIREGELIPIDQNIHRKNIDQHIPGNTKRSTHDDDEQPVNGDDDLAEKEPPSLSGSDASLNEQSSTSSEVNDRRLEGQYEDALNIELPIDEIITEYDIPDLDDGAIAPEGVREYVLPSTTYNVLFLGETQSGKSTLIESLKQYANPDYTINTKKIGDGTFSLTNDVRIERIASNLPTSYIFEASDKTQEPVNHDAFIEMDQEDYEDELNDRKSYLLAMKQSNIPNAYYNLIDTPGLNNTGSNDKSKLEYIFKRIGNISELDLVVVTVSNNPFTQDLKDDLKSYFELLKDFKGHLVFVHTKIDYAKLHKEDEQFKQLLEEKNSILDGLLGQEAPHIMIDNDLGSKKAVRNCMTQNTLRDLLDKARTNEPVRLPEKYRRRPSVYPNYSQSYDYSSFGAGMGHREHMGGFVYTNDPRYASIIVIISDGLEARGIAPGWAYNPVVIAMFESAMRHRCQRR
ncbi:hypothetical protein BGZ81_004775 [Podila clonocystis]|nr:hypothetical protein BGZ81_004775 [Podila clonocystis]